MIPCFGIAQLLFNFFRISLIYLIILSLFHFDCSFIFRKTLTLFQQVLRDKDETWSQEASMTSETRETLRLSCLEWFRILLESGADMHYCHVSHGCHSCMRSCFYLYYCSDLIEVRISLFFLISSLEYVLLANCRQHIASPEV
jgi:hypothetical protein